MGSDNGTYSKSLTKTFLLWWVSITIIYSFLFVLFLNESQSSSIGGYVAGFFGLFTPIGPLTLLTSWSPIILLSNVVSVVLIFLAIKLGNKIGLVGVVNKTIFILLSLLLITVIADFARQIPFASWQIFFDGSMEFLSS